MLKVVIADDEARVCQLILMLADWDGLGMEVAGVASNGLEALELVERLRPDILITDIRMPGCHGLELIERAKDKFPQLEIIGWNPRRRAPCGKPTASGRNRGCISLRC